MTVFDDDQPTPPLAAFLAAYADDDNHWWRLSCGHHQNLFEAAVDERDQALITAAGLNTMITRVACLHAQDDEQTCVACQTAWPCRTIRALTGELQ